MHALDSVLHRNHVVKINSEVISDRLIELGIIFQQKNANRWRRICFFRADHLIAGLP